MHSFDRGYTEPGDRSGEARLGASRPAARVLIVEDQVLIALSLAADLAAMGCDVVGRAASGEHAIAAARRLAPEIVLMDVHLAGVMDGIEAAAHIQSCCRAHIIFMTAHAHGPDRTRMEALHPTGILGKPYEPADLAHIIAETEVPWEPSLPAAV